MSPEEQLQKLLYLRGCDSMTADLPQHNASADPMEMKYDVIRDLERMRDEANHALSIVCGWVPEGWSSPLQGMDRASRMAGGEGGRRWRNTRT